MCHFLCGIVRILFRKNKSAREMQAFEVEGQNNRTYTGSSRVSSTGDENPNDVSTQDGQEGVYYEGLCPAGSKFAFINSTWFLLVMLWYYYFLSPKIF